MLFAVWVVILNSSGEVVESTDNVISLSFETVLPGGFGSASFVLLEEYRVLYNWYTKHLGKSVVFYSPIGETLYEGRIETMDLTATDLRVSCVGWYAAANDLTNGLIYPISTAKSASDIIIDAIDLVTDWNDYNYAEILDLSTDITPQDFTGDVKISESIEECLKYGDDSTPPQELHFAIWENKVPFLFIEPYPWEDPRWFVKLQNFVDLKGYSTSRSKANVYNKIQVLYDDPDIGKTFTAWAEDTDSQSVFGVREGTINIGQSQSGVAIVVRDIAIETFAYPRQSSRLSIGGLARTFLGIEKPIYYIRAGDQLRVSDFEAVPEGFVQSSTGWDVASAFITRTRYNADSGVLQLDLGTSKKNMDILMVRLGISAGSIK
jgi:hypothetical protein